MLRVKTSTVREWLRNKKIPFYQVGKRKLIKEEDLELFLEMRKEI